MGMEMQLKATTDLLMTCQEDHMLLKPQMGWGMYMLFINLFLQYCTCFL